MLHIGFANQFDFDSKFLKFMEFRSDEFKCSLIHYGMIMFMIFLG
jgi:hypothetical protein